MTGFYTTHAILFQQTAVFAFLAMSFQIVFRSGVFSFASAGFYTIGAYAAADFSKIHMPLYPTLLLVITGSAIFGYFLSFPFVRLRGLYLGMVTFAFSQILIVIANNLGGLTGGAVGLFGVTLQISSGELFLILGLTALLMSQLERRSLGRSLQVLRSDEQLARAMGNEVIRQRAFIFAVSSALGGLAGALNTITTTVVAPTGFGFNLIVTGLSMAIIGGIGSWVGALIGAAFVTWFPDLFGFVGVYKTIVYGVLLVIVIVFEPGGVFGLLQRLFSLLRGAASKGYRKNGAAQANSGQSTESEPLSRAETSA